MAIPVKLDAFEGPLHLLLHLINKDKIDIYNIPIFEITQQYLEFIHKMDIKDLDIMSEFLVMAAYLLEIKSRLLLPVEEKEEEEDPRSELVDRLLEYIEFKEISKQLKKEYDSASNVLYKAPSIPEEIVDDYNPRINLDQMLKDIKIESLYMIYKSIIKKQKDKIDPVRSKFKEIEMEEVDLSDKLLKIQRYGMKKRNFMFSDLFTHNTSKMEFIVTFLGVLELIKTGRVLARQDNLFDDIYIEYLANDIIVIEEALL